MPTGPACRALMSLALGAAALSLAGLFRFAWLLRWSVRAAVSASGLVQAWNLSQDSRAALAKCAASPAVIRVGKLKPDGDQPAATVFTRDFGKSAKTSALLSCLNSSPAVALAAWPD